MSYQSVTLCYTTSNNFKRNWICEMGYKSISEADERAFELKEQNKDIITKLYPQTRNSYELTQKATITYNLSSLIIPNVTLRQKPDEI